MLIAPDKFKGTLSALEVAEAMGRAAASLGIQTLKVPLADGGEGIVSVLGGPNRTSEVSGPLEEKVIAPWRLENGTAVIELASASGLTLVGGASKNNPLKATSRGTGELIAEAITAGASRIIVGAGGSACTDGGLGAVEVLTNYAPLDGSRGYQLTIACDVQTPFLEAAEVFGPQKGATPHQVVELTGTLQLLVQQYKEEFGVHVNSIRGSGAAGGFAGGMAALGALTVDGFELIAREIDFETSLRKCDFVLTGEGSLDQTSFEGKVVGSVLTLAMDIGIPCGVVAGRIAENVKGDFFSASLVSMYGATQAMNATAKSVESATGEILKQFLSQLSDTNRGEKI
ncbi:MAG: glycerate kinase [Actinobacteria bacterium]|nr:glycerate kinase [Actinomycetota bacterium]